MTAQNKSRQYGDADPAFTYTLNGFFNGDNSSVVSGAAVLGSSSPAGKYEITAGQGTLAASNYDFAPIFGTLTVTP